MSRRVFVVGLVVESEGELPGRDDMACWLTGLVARGGIQTRIADCTVWDNLGDLVADLCSRKALGADPVLRAIGKAELSRPGLVGGVPPVRS